MTSPTNSAPAGSSLPGSDATGEGRSGAMEPSPRLSTELPQAAIVQMRGLLASSSLDGLRRWQSVMRDSRPLWPTEAAEVADAIKAKGTRP